MLKVQNQIEHNYIDTKDKFVHNILQSFTILLLRKTKHNLNNFQTVASYGIVNIYN